jgi:hypothetical protein
VTGFDAKLLLSFLDGDDYRSNHIANSSEAHPSMKTAQRPNGH